MQDRGGRDVLDDEPLTPAGAAVDDAPPEQAPEAINDRSSRIPPMEVQSLTQMPHWINQTNSGRA